MDSTQTSQFTHLTLLWEKRTLARQAELINLRQPRRWIGALWVWWAVSSLCLLCMWAMALGSSTISLLNARQISAMSHIKELSTAFSSMEKLQMALVSSLSQESPLSPRALANAQRQATPFCRIYWVGTGGKAVSGDQSAPTWMMALSIPRLGSNKGCVVVRPLPPGMEAGRLSAAEAAVPAGTPENYLLVCARTRDGALIISSMDLNYVFDGWLAQQTRQFGPDATIRAARAEQAPPPVPDPIVDIYSLGQARTWRWRIQSFLADDPYPFQPVEVEVSNERALRENLAQHLLALAGGALLMTSFAFSIRLAARGVRRELEFAEARSQFTAMVSHELRTPIAAVRMYAEILQNRLVDDPEKVAAYHDIISREAGRLGHMVDSLLEVGALERGTRIFQLEKLDVNDLLRSLSAGREVELQLDPSLPALRADRQALIQVLENLVQNALKYGGSPPQVVVRSRKSQSGVAIEVLDRGPGIPADLREKVFEPYQRLSNLQSKPGVGLGLAVVKGFVEGQGGTVEVTDRPGGGSVFTVNLPLEEEAP